MNSIIETAALQATHSSFCILFLLMELISLKHVTMSYYLKEKTWVIPFGGNSFITSPAESPSLEAVITDFGVENWKSPSTSISLYFHSKKPTRVYLALRLSVPEGSSRIKLALSHHDNKTMTSKEESETLELEVQGSEFHLESCGIFTIALEGYMKLEISGVAKTGSEFSSVSDVVLTDDSFDLSQQNQIRFVDNPKDFYYGRRGPTATLWFHLDTLTNNYEYFYNEIYVPKDQDVIGSYYCAMGFEGGYFGIQVNAKNERRILFSVWSEYDTDNPSEIPHDYKVKLIRKGAEVHVGEFGNEGAGAQSYLKYRWQSEKLYRFMALVAPIDSERTMYTAWFSDDGSAWYLIASFEKPKVSTYLKGLYSFSENFLPSMGYIQRHFILGNQWVLDVDGNWLEITEATFDADYTAKKKIRMDVSGGVGIYGDSGTFFLRNCGFFGDRVVPGTVFRRISSRSIPPIDVSHLP